MSAYKSGGISICVRKNIRDKVQFINTKSKYVLWCKISQTLLGNDKDILLGGVYIPPEGTTYSDISSYNDIEKEMLEINKDEECWVTLCGDFNSYVGVEPDIVSIDSHMCDVLDIDPTVRDNLDTEHQLEILGIKKKKISG